MDGWQHLYWPTEDNKPEWILKISNGLSSLSRLYAREIIKCKLKILFQNSEENQSGELKVTLNIGEVLVYIALPLTSYHYCALLLFKFGNCLW